MFHAGYITLHKIIVREPMTKIFASLFYEQPHKINKLGYCIFDSIGWTVPRIKMIPPSHDQPIKTLRGHMTNMYKYVYVYTYIFIFSLCIFQVSYKHTNIIANFGVYISYILLSDLGHIIETSIWSGADRYQFRCDGACGLRHRLWLRPVRVRQLGRVRAGQLLVDGDRDIMNRTREKRTPKTMHTNVMCTYCIIYFCIFNITWLRSMSASKIASRK